MTNGQLYGGSIAACTKSVLQHDGLGGLYSGLLPRTLYIGKLCFFLEGGVCSIAMVPLLIAQYFPNGNNKHVWSLDRDNEIE